ncbi:MAG: ester cyclase [Desulforhopalus sp.]
MEKSERRNNKEIVWKFLSDLEGTPSGQYEKILRCYYTDDAVWEIFHPFNTLEGPQKAAVEFWDIISHSIPDVERRLDIFAGDIYRNEYWVTTMGHLCGTFSRPFLGIPATQRVVYLRIGEFHKVDGGKIVKSHILLDIPDLMRQAGTYPFRPMPGAVGYMPGPRHHNGMRLQEDDPGQATLDTVLSMHKALHDFNGKDMDSMQHSHCWSEHFLYHAPAGIGTTRGLASFKKHHQQPFLRSFPDRYGTEHYARISDGPIAATTHWGTLTATHTGSNWLCLPATGKKLKMRVADWYCANDEGKLHENWLFMDIPDICLQMGFDLFGNMNLLTGK